MNRVLKNYSLTTKWCIAILLLIILCPLVIMLINITKIHNYNNELQTWRIIDSKSWPAEVTNINEYTQNRIMKVFFREWDHAYYALVGETKLLLNAMQSQNLIPVTIQDPIVMRSLRDMPKEFSHILDEHQDKCFISNNWKNGMKENGLWVVFISHQNGRSIVNYRHDY